MGDEFRTLSLGVKLLVILLLVYIGFLYPLRGDRMNAMVSTHKHRKKVVDRLSRIEGHLRGVKKMVEDDRDCPELLHQIAAIKAAIHKVGVLILEDHIESCMVDAVKEGSVEDYVEQLKAAVGKLI